MSAGAAPHTRRFQVGVQFEDMDAARKESIEKTIATFGGGMLSGPLGIRRKDS